MESKDLPLCAGLRVLTHDGLQRFADSRFSVAQVERNILPEVLEFDAFLAKHGTDLGWHPDDHREFCRQHQAANGNFEACMAATSAQLFHMDPDALSVHARCIC